MPADPISLALIAKAAPIVLPLASVFFKTYVGTDSKIIQAFADLGLNIAAGTTGPAIEKLLGDKPDLVHHLSNQHFLRYTGDVLAALITRFADQPHMQPQRAALLKLATEAPEGWLTFVRAGAPGLQPLRHDEFLRTLASSMAPGSPGPDLSQVPFTAFFSWHVRLGAEVATKLDAYLKTHLPTALHAALVSDVPSAQAAYREVIHCELLSLRTDIREIQRQLGEQGEKLDDLRDSPGFDLHAYARKLVDHCELIPLSEKGGTDTRHRISLSSVFVPPSVRAFEQIDPDHLDLDTEAAESARRDRLDHLDPAKRPHAEYLRNLHRDQPVRPAMDVLADPDQPGLIVLGDAGVGKTSLVRHLALQWAQAYLQPQPDQPFPQIPLLIELRRFAAEASKEAGFSLLDYLHQCEISIERLDRAWCRYYLQSDSAILILDGLDEVSDHQLRKTIAKDATRLRKRGYRILVTSRRVGFIQQHWEERMNLIMSPSVGVYNPPPIPPWSRHLLQEFDDPQRDLFVQKTHLLLYPNDIQRQEKTSAFRVRLARYPAIERLTRNPLLLTLACLLHRTGALGDNRVDLYAAASEMLLDTWELVRTENDVAPPEHNLPTLTKGMKVRIVRRLARKIIESADTRHLGENLFPIGLLQQAVREVIDPSGSQPVQAEAYAQLMPGLLRERHSLLCWAGEDQYSFIHRSFLEFFAAQAWAEDKDLAALSKKAIEKRLLIGDTPDQPPRWRDERFQNILPLYYGQLGDDRAAERLPLLWKLRSADAPEENVLFAASCFVEVKAREEHPEFAQQLRQRLLALAEATWQQAYEGDHKAEPFRDRCRRALRALVQLWGSTPDLQDWLHRTLHEPGASFTLRAEIIQQLGALHGPTDTLRTQLHAALITSGSDHSLRNLVCQALDQAWGQTGLFQALASQPETARLEVLDLHGCTGLRSTQGLPPLPALKTLSLDNCTGLEGAAAFQGLTGLDRLEQLYLSGCASLRSTQGLPRLPALKQLWLMNCTGLEGAGALQGLTGLDSLEEFYLIGCTGLRSTQGLPTLPALKQLWVMNCTGLEGAAALHGLTGLDRLEKIDFDGCTGLRSTEGLPRLPALKTLDLQNCTGLEGATALQGLAMLERLETLHLDGCTGLRSTQSLPPLPALKRLSLQNCTGLEGSPALQGLTGLDLLETLDLDGCTGLRSTQGLPPLPALKTLSLRNCTGLEGATALQGLTMLERLETLDLDGCTGLEGSAALQGLTGLDRLEELDLDGCTGLRSTQGLPPLPALKTLSLRNCTGLDKQALEELRRQLPDSCRIFNPNGSRTGSGSKKLTYESHTSLAHDSPRSMAPST